MGSKGSDDLDAGWDSPAAPAAASQAEDAPEPNAYAATATATPSSTPPPTEGVDEGWDVDIPAPPKIPARPRPAKERKPKERRPSKAAAAAVAKPLPRSGVFTARDRPGKKRQRLQEASRAHPAKTGEKRAARVKRRAQKKARRQQERREAAKAANVAANPAQAKAKSEVKVTRSRRETDDAPKRMDESRRTSATRAREVWRSLAAEASRSREDETEYAEWSAQPERASTKRPSRPMTRQLRGIVVVLAMAAVVALLIWLAGGH